MERRKAILDAAEALLAERGYEAATLKAIGERAGIPAASMYHYFADRYQVDAELLRRHLSELDGLIGAMLAEPRARTLREAVDILIDLLLDYLRRHRSCTELWFAGRHATLDDMVRAFDEAQAERLWHHLVEQRFVAADTPLLALLLAFETGTRLFDIAFRRSPAADDATIDEARRLVTAYLETYAIEGARPPTAGADG
ncbi:TetR/AcrR family transcriptional regulator [Streptomyces mobaraensis]|uniref:TetR/AcrR family transcriptional regulator n=1 Tax=Streptomyces mobaraensis TaxID=35621 RepID=A0A5N5W904_STRMB|nr:TetR/AcrR family transcriptional regulator [Streptomyces mobaraensis]KAB7846197.1 TetR/AcrR family transcriptional regulator [Streptomyces mobaraensis]